MIFDSNYDLKDESETLRLAESMASHLFPGMNLYLIKKLDQVFAIYSLYT